MSVYELGKKLVDERHFWYWGSAGSLVGLIFILTPMIPYQGTEGEMFSIFTHYISQLGEIGVSIFSPMFNIGMILAGFLYTPFMVGLGLYLRNIVGKLAALVGIYTSSSIVLVGVFPMNYHDEHTIAALSFFLSGLVMVTLWTIAIVVQNKARLPKMFAIGGLVNLFFFAAFLFWPYQQLPILESPFSLQPTFEWSIYFAIVAFLFAISLYAWRREKRIAHA